MKRLHPSGHEETLPRNLPRKSLAEDEEEKGDEGGAKKGSKRGLNVLKGLTKADQKSAGGDDNDGVVISCQNNLVLGDGENNVRTPLRSSRKVGLGLENGMTVDDPRMPRRSRRVSGSQAIILRRSRRFSGDPSSAGKCSTVNEGQRPRRCSVGETKMLNSTIGTPRGRNRSRRSLGDPTKASEEATNLVQVSKLSQRPVGRPLKVARNSQHEEHNILLSSRQRRSQGLELQVYPGKEEKGENVQNNNSLPMKAKESQYSCEVCGKEFTKASQLMEHRKDSKAHKRPYACSLSHCSRTFSQLDHLLNHKRKVHEDWRVDQCQNCSLHFSSPRALAFHSDLKYCKPPKQRSYLTTSQKTPSNCTAKFSNRNLLQLHLKLSHQEDPPDLSSFVSLQESSEEIGSRCGIPGCFEKFSDMHKLQEHEDCCRKQKQATCRNCQKEFETPLDMLLHRISCEQRVNATKNKTLPSCPNCSRKFKGDRFLQNHMKSSSCKEAFKTFTCDSSNCGKIFEKPVLLRNHLYSHTDAPFHCSRYPS